MIKERRSSASTSVLYYRRGSAGSRLAPGDLDPALIAGARILHCTGITPALSATARAATFSAVEAARAGGTLVSFDPNHRSTLWHRDEAAAVFRDLTARADILLAGEEEAEMILGGLAAPEDAARRLSELGPAHAIVKLGERGAVGCVDGTVRTVPAVRVEALDPVGAGDAFAAGYLTGLLDGEDAERALGLAAALGAWAVTVDGDWEGLPRRRELPLLAAAAGTVSR
jgi:2-dehydro-3-deoxygluconokinase